MPPSGANKTTLATIEANIATLEASISGAGEAAEGLRVLCKALRRTIRDAHRNVPGL